MISFKPIYEGVFAEDLLFATLDPTTRKVAIQKLKNAEENTLKYSKGQDILLTDTVGFISKLPTDLVAAFRATLEEILEADVLIHVIDRSSPVWEKQRDVVLNELEGKGIHTYIHTYTL